MTKQQLTVDATPFTRDFAEKIDSKIVLVNGGADNPLKG